MQRQFIVKYTKIGEVKQMTSKTEKSRRQKTMFYYLTRLSKHTMVCKKFLVSRRGLLEQHWRKSNDCGIVASDMRGGRQSENIKNRDSAIHTAIENHVNRFPRIGSHYYREKSTQEYLHFDLSISKIYSLFLEELTASDELPSITTYRTKNLSFHRPKKDQCSLCMTYKDLYEKCNSEKLKVRTVKNECKLRAATDEVVPLTCNKFFIYQNIMTLRFSTKHAYLISI
ncbi:unnamed protein product [Psylliodes chrysocephalus]|uniref:Uncharacterized protein n=1 Tax=Psylliodes chrysocephalus TaxID=3402493 RepID=A0A9P0GJH0_9CUCU|nr:unnamed protein product [Psylliodes chrysocephala]